MPNVTVPDRWRLVASHLADAQVAGRIKANPGLDAEARDRATRGYLRAADALVAELGALRRDGVLAAIEDFLRDHYRDGLDGEGGGHKGGGGAG